MKFKYKAQKSGEIIEGTLEANSRFEVYSFLKAQNAQLIALKEEKISPFSLEYINAKFASVPLREVITFADNLATMLNAGLSLSRALSISLKQSKNPKMKLVIEDLRSMVEKGENFFSALERHKSVFSNLFISMVKSGELSGNLPDALKAVAMQLDRIDTLRKRVKGAMIYPSIIVFAIFAVGAFMMVSVVPTLSKVFEDAHMKLPVATQMVISISKFLTNYLSFAIVLLLTLFVSLIVFLKTEKGKWTSSFLVLHIPIIKELAKELNAARAARTISSLFKSGVDVVETLQISSEVVQNKYYKKALLDAAKAVEKGKTLAEALKKYEGLFPTMFVELIAVGEETGSVRDMMQKVADYYEEEVNEKTKNMSTIIEPFLMLFIGIAVGFFAYAMLTPMYTITQSI